MIMALTPGREKETRKEKHENSQPASAQRLSGSLGITVEAASRIALFPD
jgi:hypothetical protein